MRYALKFGYHGKNFSGYARQPGLRTVEGDITKALKKTAIMIDEKIVFQTASRTDKGVSAIGNVLALDTAFRKSEILSALNAHLDEIWFYGIAEVPESFNPRHARQRWYRYYVFNDGHDINRIEEMARIFIGSHDFFNFARIEGNDSIRTLDSIDISKSEGFIILDFKAQGFLWHMIRRIVKAILGGANGKITKHEIRDALETKQKVDFGLVEPESLILMDVSYDFDFIFDASNLKKLKETIEKSLLRIRTDSIIYLEMLKLMDSGDSK